MENLSKYYRKDKIKEKVCPIPSRWKSYFHKCMSELSKLFPSF